MRYMLCSKPRRVGFLDELRGLCILLMVLYHAAYDLVMIFHVNILFFHWPVLRFAQSFVAGIFIFVSGIACRYSKSNAKRGLIVLALGFVITAVTFYMFKEQAIYFGILHLLGTSMLLFALLQNVLNLFSPFAGMLLFLALFAVTYRLPDGMLGLGAFSFRLPAFLYEARYLLPFGFGGMGADYFPLVPWLFLFLAGSFVGIPLRENALPRWFYDTHSKPLAAIGRRTIFIYVLHQPILYGILPLIFSLIGKPS